MLRAGQVLSKISKSNSNNEHLSQTSFELVPADYVDKRKISGRLSEVLFLLIRGKSMRRISDILGLSQRTVESYIETLKAKFIVSTKGELIEQAINEGYLNFIPKRLFENQLSLILDH